MFAWLLFSASVAGAAQPAWDLPGWAHRARLTLDGSAIDAPLDGFPLLVVLEDGRNFDHTLAAPGGADLRFVDADGAVLPYQIESWDEGGRSTVWVRLPHLEPGAADPHLWLYFGAEVAAADDPGAVWDGYTAVWHLGDDLTDSTGRHAPAHDHGSIDSPAQIAQGRGMLGTGNLDRRLEIRDTDPALDLVDGMTLSAWVSADAWHSGFEAVLAKGDHTWRIARCRSDDAFAFALDVEGGQVEICGATGPVAGGGWYHVAATYDRAQMHLYVDGVPVAYADETRPVRVDTDQVWIGNNSDADDRQWLGVLDEVRIEATPRSAAWIAADAAAGRDELVSSWCVPDLGLGDTDGDGTCDVDEDRGVAVDTASSIDTATAPGTDVPSAAGADRPPAAVTADEPALAGCGCGHGGVAGWVWLPAMALVVRRRPPRRRRPVDPRQRRGGCRPAG
ncbi:MAG: DUF2341 domain-containing protein [Myxococcota bacterium]